jgi:hypothetical protein
MESSVSIHLNLRGHTVHFEIATQRRNVEAAARTAGDGVSNNLHKSRPNMSGR